MKAPNLVVGEYLKVGAGNVIESTPLAPNWDYVSEWVFSNPTPRSTMATTMTKVKETRILEPLLDKFRTYFEMRSLASGETTYAQVYRNGSPVGTLRSVTTTTFTAFEEDIAGWSKDDLYQIYAYTAPGNLAGVEVQNQRIGVQRYGVATAGY